MPIYEYKCEGCGNSFEKLIRRSTEVAELACPSCGGHHLNQEFSTFAARAGDGASAMPEMPSCPGGMCGNPGMCGRNN